MMAAITAAERGHEVILFEKSGALGGLLKIMDHEPAKWEVTRYKDFLIRKALKTVNDIRLNTEATPEMVEALAPDVVIAAVGSTPIIPDVPGLDKKTALTVMDVYYSTEKIGQNIIIIGGGLLGCEAALFLANQGRKVKIIEMLNQIGDPGYPHYNIPLIEAIDNHPDISYELQTKCVEVTPDGVRVEKEGTEKIIAADSIVFLVGREPEFESVEKLRDCSLEFYSIGDCVKPQRIMEATQTGFFSAMNIL
jgi:pyruvate/2-oxoglutarate dehydrogenase complex dihydrolipoamide dehydrogenase (E3) component